MHLLVVFSLFLGAHALVNKFAARSVDLTGSLARESLFMEVMNDHPHPVKNYVFYTPKDRVINYAKATNMDTKAELDFDTVVSTDAMTHTLTLDKPLAQGESIILQVLLVYSHALKPYPPKAPQSGPQVVQYTTPYYHMSAYPTTTYEVTVVFPEKIVVHATPNYLCA
jgi:oligosaccharyltransferase complex subunit alpha (ribophorin I)